MTFPPRRHRVLLSAGRRIASWGLVAVLALVGISLGGCGGGGGLDVPPVNVEKPAEAKEPEAADLTTPQNAVRSYLDFVTYAYRVGDSDVASHTMGPDELIRVDSYIELDRQRGRRIDQRLDSITFGTAVSEGADKEFVPAQEAWTYRYIDTATGGFKGPAKRASFTATYTVERAPAGWVVTSVEATSSAPVQ